jgi:hypothetical protein
MGDKCPMVTEQQNDIKAKTKRINNCLEGTKPYDNAQMILKVCTVNISYEPNTPYYNYMATECLVKKINRNARSFKYGNML